MKTLSLICAVSFLLYYIGVNIPSGTARTVFLVAGFLGLVVFGCALIMAICAKYEGGADVEY
jgi:hypothetical protein